MNDNLFKHENSDELLRLLWAAFVVKRQKAHLYFGNGENPTAWIRFNNSGDLFYLDHKAGDTHIPANFSLKATQYFLPEDKEKVEAGSLFVVISPTERRRKIKVVVGDSCDILAEKVISAILEVQPINSFLERPGASRSDLVSELQTRARVNNCNFENVLIGFAEALEKKDLDSFVSTFDVSGLADAFRDYSDAQMAKRECTVLLPTVGKDLWNFLLYVYFYSLRDLDSAGGRSQVREQTLQLVLSPIT